jgi:hypothetical protein
MSYTPYSTTDEKGRPIVKTQKDWLFGAPVLMSGGSGKAHWAKGSQVLGTHQKGTGWVADLYGGVQSGDDWAACYIPVNDLPLTEFNTALWSWYQTATETMGLGIVIWIHDPDDFDKRAEVSQLGGHADLEKAAGWNAHEFSKTTAGMFFYGENTTGTGLTAGTQYSWYQFQQDALFKDWTIYRISFDWGWEASGTFESSYLAEVKLNGTYLELKPQGTEHTKTIVATKILECEGGYSDEDVMSESDTASAGTDWDFDFGGTGKITKAILHHPTTAMTFGATLFLFTSPPTCELDDNAANDAPAAADVPYFVGTIVFPAMSDLGGGGSYSVATPALTTGNLPLAFDAPVLYGVIVITDAADPGDDTLLTITLTAEMDN